jgi:hypothetical protein
VYKESIKASGLNSKYTQMTAKVREELIAIKYFWYGILKKYI